MCVYMRLHSPQLRNFPRKVGMDDELRICLGPFSPTMSLQECQSNLRILDSTLAAAVNQLGVSAVTRICDSFLRDEVRSTSLNALLVHYLQKYPEELGEICERCIAHITPDTVACGALRGRKVPVTIFQDKLTFEISLGEFYEEWTGSRVWPGAVHLSRAFLNREFDIADREVLELGSGLGILGIAALRAGAYRVTFTEYKDSLLDCCRENVQNNAPGDLASSTSYFNLNWDGFTPSNHPGFLEWSQSCNTSKELVFIGSELVYDDSHPELVISLITKLFDSGFSRGIICVMINPSRAGFSRFRFLMESLPCDSVFKCEILKNPTRVSPTKSPGCSNCIDVIHRCVHFLILLLYNINQSRLGTYLPVTSFCLTISTAIVPRVYDNRILSSRCRLSFSRIERFKYESGSPCSSS